VSFFGLFADDEEEKNIESKESITPDFSHFEAITSYIYERSGITDLDSRAMIANQLRQLALEHDIYNTDTFLQKMKSSDEFYQEIINLVTVNETYFFRELKELEWLVDYIKGLSTHFKILSMPCSSGEEVYSILILLSEAGVDINRVEITGYDINSDAVSKAQKAIFKERSLHKIPLHVREKYFTKIDDESYKLREIFKNRVSFYQKNIFELENIYNKFDVVLSRNMFIYFDSEKRAKAVDIIASLLKIGGIYIKGHADSIKEHPNLKNISYGVYKKI
jgi:chemotaxis protein methyltransferase CheR